MSTTHTIDCDRTALTAHLTACLEADRIETNVALLVANAVHDYLSVQGKRFDKRVADHVGLCLANAGFEGAQVWWKNFEGVTKEGNRFEVCYRLKGTGEYKSCRVYRKGTTEYGEWFENYSDGPTGCYKRLKRIEAAVDTIDAIVDGIIAVRVAEAALRFTLNYDGLHNEMHPLAYEVTEARERRR
jgi:hypothetical protein